MAVNVRGSFLVAKHALAAMRDGGSLIFNSSVVGLLSEAGICAYATSKHAIVGLMRTAAKEGAPRGIRVNSVHPGPVDNRFQHTIEVDVTGAPEERPPSCSRRSSRWAATRRPRRSRERCCSSPERRARS